MPSIKVDGLDDVFARLKAIGGDIESVQKRAVYAGMGVIRDEVVRQIEQLPVQKGYLKSKDLPRDVITPREKEQLIKHIGIASMDLKNGRVKHPFMRQAQAAAKARAIEAAEKAAREALAEIMEV